MTRVLALLLVALALPSPGEGQEARSFSVLSARLDVCGIWETEELRRNPTEAELRCRYGIRGPGRFGLSYAEVPVYQTVTPLPGTHVVGVPGLPRPAIGESYEAWEWRVLRTDYGREVLNVHRGLELLDPLFAERLMRFERRLAEEGIRATRRETWRSWSRQAYLFQQGRSRPGYLVTTTLTSWHCRVDERGNPASRAADYHVSGRQMPRFHEIAWEVGLESFGPDSYDPGHVFMPASEEIEEGVRALLRVLPVVPVVTLATGRPADEHLPRHLLADYRTAAREFASEPFIPFPEVRHAGAGTVHFLWAEAATPPAAPQLPLRRPAVTGVLDRFFCGQRCAR